MRLAVITAFPDLYTNRRLAETASRQGLDLDFLAPDDRLPAKTPDAALLRVGMTGTQDAFLLARGLANRGVRIMNRADACMVAKDKWLTYDRLRRAGVPQVPTRLLEPEQPLDSILPDEALGTFPLVVKTRLGTKGVGVHLADDIDDVQDLRRRYARSGYSVLLQRFVRPIREFRVLVIDNKVRAVVKRSPAPREFRANWHRGAGLTAIEDPPQGLTDFALIAHGASRLDYSGVDLFQTDKGYRVIELNDAPGLEGIEEATGLDLATPIIEHLASLARA